MSFFLLGWAVTHHSQILWMNVYLVINYCLFFFCLTPGAIFYKLQIVRIWLHSVLLTVGMIRRIHLTYIDDKIKCHILLHTSVPSVWAILNARFKEVPAGHVFQGCLHIVPLAFSIYFLLRSFGGTVKSWKRAWAHVFVVGHSPVLLPLHQLPGRAEGIATSQIASP